MRRRLGLLLPGNLSEPPSRCQGRLACFPGGLSKWGSRKIGEGWASRTGGGPGGATLSLSVFGYRYLASGDFGYGSALSMVLFMMAFGLAVCLIRLGRMGQVIE